MLQHSLDQCSFSFTATLITTSMAFVRFSQLQIASIIAPPMDYVRIICVYAKAIGVGLIAVHKFAIAESVAFAIKMAVNAQKTTQVTLAR